MFEPGDRVRIPYPNPLYTKGTVLQAGTEGKIISRYKSFDSDDYIYGTVWQPRDIMVPVKENEVEKI